MNSELRYLVYYCILIIACGTMGYMLMDDTWCPTCPEPETVGVVFPGGLSMSSSLVDTMEAVEYSTFQIGDTVCFYGRVGVIVRFEEGLGFYYWYRVYFEDTDRYEVVQECSVDHIEECGEGEL